MDIDAKVAIVTGAGSGIGEAIALRLAAEGAAVVVSDIDEVAGLDTVQQIEAAGGRGAFVRADVSSEAGVRDMVAFAEKTFGGLDILVNNAGITTGPVRFPDTDPQTWIRAVEVNLLGVILGTQYGAQAMRRRGGGLIINIASMAGIGYGPNPLPAYAASKAGVVRFTAALAYLKVEMNVRVNCVCPDVVDTPMVQRSRQETPPGEKWPFEGIPLLKAEEVAEAALVFVRDDSLAGRVMYNLCGEPPHLVPQLDGLVWSASPERIDILGWHEMRSYFARPSDQAPPS